MKISDFKILAAQTGRGRQALPGISVRVSKSGNALFVSSAAAQMINKTGSVMIGYKERESLLMLVSAPGDADGAYRLRAPQRAGKRRGSYIITCKAALDTIGNDMRHRAIYEGAWDNDLGGLVVDLNQASLKS